MTVSGNFRRPPLSLRVAQWWRDHPRRIMWDWLDRLEDRWRRLHH